MTSLLIFTAIATGLVGFILGAVGNFKYVGAELYKEELAAKQLIISGLILLCLSLLLWFAALPDVLKIIS